MYFSRRAKIISLCLAFFVGVGTASYLALPLFLMVCAVSGACVLLLCRKTFFASVLVVSMVGFVWFGVYESNKQGSVTQFFGKKQTFEARVSDVSLSSSGQELVLNIRSVEGKDATGRLRTRLQGDEGIQKDSLVKVTGTAERTEDASFQRYLFGKNISGEIAFPKIEVVGHEKSFILIRLADSLRELCSRNLSRILAPPLDAFLGGLLIGTRDSLPQNLKDTFKATGTTHIIAISGFNIAIILNVFEAMLAKFLKPKIRLGVIIFGIIFFVLLVGASASVVRAAIMGCLAFFGKRSGRMVNSLLVLALSCLFMVLTNPKMLIYDIGFQLSALATFGILGFSKFFETKLSFLPENFEFRSTVSTTLAAQVPVLPILIMQFHQMSSVFLVSNVLVLPLIPFVMATGFAALVGSFISTTLGVFLATLPKYILLGMIKVLEHLGSFSFALVPIHMPATLLLVYALAVILTFFEIQKRAWHVKSL